MTDYSGIYPRIKPVSEDPPTVAVYDRPVSEVTDWHNQCIGTVFAGSNGVEAYRPHDSLADRHAAKVPGAPFRTVGDGVIALIRDYDDRNRFINCHHHHNGPLPCPDQDDDNH